MNFEQMTVERLLSLTDYFFTINLRIKFVNLVFLLRGVIQAMLFNQEAIKVRRMEVPDVDTLIKICRADKINPNQGGFIYPGTKWCGPGNIAKSWDDLGPNTDEDKCCRAHDNCPQSLKSGECRPGICNNSPFTRSHCDCDAELRKCLQTINTDVSNTIGAIFFNVIQVTCIKERRPCSKWQRYKKKLFYSYS